MRVLRGRATTLTDDREATRRFFERTTEAGKPAVRVWQPHPHVAFGRRDTNREGYEVARQVADEWGYLAIERAVGGHAVAYTGNTVAFALAEPVDESRSGIQDRYGRVEAAIRFALADLGIDATVGEPDGAFCPGTHSLSSTGKIVGIAQRVRTEYAVTSGIVIVRDHDQIADVLDPVYDALDVPFERDAVGSIARAGGNAVPSTVIGTIERHLAGVDPEVETVRET